MKNITVVIGAGLSGLLVARTLQDRGAEVLVLEKSRGLGGRMATKRVGDAVFDQGAQFFTVRDPQMAALVAEWERQGWVESWPGGCEQRLIGSPSMTAVGKGIAKDLCVKLQQQVTSVHYHECGCWELHIADAGIVRAERLVLASPVPQSLALLDAGGVVLDATLRTALDRLVYYPCLAVLVRLDGPSGVPSDGLKPESGPIRWIADNAAKGVSPLGRGALTVHLNPEFSAAHYGESETMIMTRVWAEIEPYLGGSHVVARKLHRWRFAEPVTTHPESFVWIREKQLGFCGDAFGGPRVSGAINSGLALGQAIAEELEA